MIRTVSRIVRPILLSSSSSSGRSLSWIQRPTPATGEFADWTASLQQVVPRRALFTGRRQSFSREGTRDTREAHSDKFYSTTSQGDSEEMSKTRGNVEKQAKHEQTWEEWKEKYLKMDLAEKRKKYKNKWNLLSDVPTWPKYYKQNEKKIQQETKASKKLEPLDPAERPPVDEELNKKVSLWRGDITTLEIDAIANAANETLLGGGGVDGAIHHAAGRMLKHECQTLNGCDTGDAKITGGFKLPAKYVIHTVGPRKGMEESEKLLRNSYRTTLDLVHKHQLRSIALPCISTGVYGFRHDSAARIALSTTREFLEEHRDEIDRVIFCLFMPKDVDIYHVYMQQYFPLTSNTNTPTSAEGGETEDSKEKSSGPGKTSLDESLEKNTQKKSRVEDSTAESQSPDGERSSPSSVSHNPEPSGNPPGRESPSGNEPAESSRL